MSKWVSISKTNRVLPGDCIVIIPFLLYHTAMWESLKYPILYRILKSSDQLLISDQLFKTNSAQGRDRVHLEKTAYHSMTCILTCVGSLVLRPLHTTDLSRLDPWVPCPFGCGLHRCRERGLKSRTSDVVYNVQEWTSYFASHHFVNHKVLDFFCCFFLSALYVSFLKIHYLLISGICSRKENLLAWNTVSPSKPFPCWNATSFKKPSTISPPCGTFPSEY